MLGVGLGLLEEPHLPLRTLATLLLSLWFFTTTLDASGFGGFRGQGTQSLKPVKHKGVKQLEAYLEDRGTY